MTTLTLYRLTLTNFKGIREFTLEANGQAVSVYGDNATGKTTLADAFMWLLFDKDSANRKDFEIKTLDHAGQPHHGLEHAVEAVLAVNGQCVTLRKVFQEKWTKKRGSATAEFTGHTTDYYIDQVPVRKTEYDARVAQIAPERVFRLLTDPGYFSEVLHWQERRRILLEVCGDLSDAQVIAADRALADLPTILGSRQLDEHRKVIQARKAEVNKELQKLPTRIDEVMHGLPDTGSLSPADLPEDLAKLRVQRQERAQALARLQSGGEAAELTKRLREVEGEMLRREQAEYARHEAHVREARQAASELEARLGQVSINLRTRAREREELEASIQRQTTQLETLRADFHRIAGEAYTGADTCPNCGQSLPEEQIEAAWERFNVSKAERLESINQAGQGAKTRLAEWQARVNEIHTVLAALQDEDNQLAAALRTARAELEARRSGSPPVSPDRAQLQAEQERLERAIADIRAGGQEAVEAVRAELCTLDAQIATLEQAQARATLRLQGLRRIEELKAEERRLAVEYERLEWELHLTEQFIRTKVGLLTDHINSRFTHATFKLFDVQINGAVAECCETLYQGVPYGGGLNRGARLNVGLDIINCLSEHYSFVAPIWVDNREAVTRLITTRAQLISLLVSEPDKSLRVEVM